MCRGTLIFVSVLALAGPAGARRVQLSTRDVLGEPVRLGSAEQQRVTAVFFMSRTCKEESADFVRRFDEQVLDAPVESVGIVDVRKYGGLTRSIAQWQLRKAANVARTHRRERRERNGVDASAQFVNRWHLLGDFDGSLFKQFDVEAEPAHPLALVVDLSGTVRGPYRDLQSLLQGIFPPSQEMPSK